MLFYNAKKEFVGMDEEGLRSLGFSNLSELMAESADFADLFVRTPGFIHNFKYVHWIDYIIYGGSSDIPKAIIHTKAKNYWCNIDITTSYMADAPAAKAYMIHLVNLRELSQQETDDMIADITAKPAPYALEIEEAPFIHPSVKENIKKSIEKQNQSFNQQIQEAQPNVQKKSPKPKVEPSKPSQEVTAPVAQTQDSTALNIDENIYNDAPEQQDLPTQEIENKSQEKEPENLPQETQQQETNEELGFDLNYEFDPQVASDELGLPIDLIEEFVEDFIVQAKEFKDDLYKYADEEDINNVRILSHKLKGVAANLRVENAFDVLVIINTAEDIQVIRKHLDYLYMIIAKLNGEEPIAIVPQEETQEEDDLILAFKEEDEATTNNNETSSEEDPLDQLSNIQTVDEPQIKEEPPAPDQNDLDIPLDINLELVDDTDNTIEPKQETQNNTTEATTLQNLDIEQASQELGMEIENYKELLQDYIVDANDLCNAISNAIGENDEQKWKQQTTKLKGMSETMKTYGLISNEMNSLLETSQQGVAQNAIDTITKVISNIKV